MSEPATKKATSLSAHQARLKSDKQPKLSLYTYWRSSCSWRVRIALNILGLEFESIPIHLVKNGGEQHSKQYRDLNPSGQVPLLVVHPEGKSDTATPFTVAQSLAIIEYLVEAFPDRVNTLLPADLRRRSTVRHLSQLIAANIQSLQNLSVLLRLMSVVRQYAPSESKDELAQRHKLMWGRHWIEQGFAALEKEVKRCAGKYCVGDNVTMVDLCLVPQLYNARRFKCDLTPFPTLVAIEKRLGELGAFKKAHPDQQPDAPQNQ